MPTVDEMFDTFAELIANTIREQPHKEEFLDVLRKHFSGISQDQLLLGLLETVCWMSIGLDALAEKQGMTDILENFHGRKHGYDA